MLELEKILLDLGKEKTVSQGSLLNKKGESLRAIYISHKNNKITGIEPTLLGNSENYIYGLFEVMADNPLPQNLIAESGEMKVHEITKERFQEALIDNKAFQQQVMRLLLSRMSTKQCCFE